MEVSLGLSSQPKLSSTIDIIFAHKAMTMGYFDTFWINYCEDILASLSLFLSISVRTNKMVYFRIALSLNLKKCQRESICSLKNQENQLQVTNDLKLPPVGLNQLRLSRDRQNSLESPFINQKYNQNRMKRVNHRDHLNEIWSIMKNKVRSPTSSYKEYHSF